MARGIIRISGLIYMGLGLVELACQRASSHANYFTLGIGASLVGYGSVALLTPITFGTKSKLKSSTATERLAKITKLKSQDLLSDAEYETRRQEILKDI